MKTYYSQQGEDFLLDVLFDHKRKGYYMEIGCIEGIRFSNSYYFEKLGWEGICVEAHHDYVNALKKNRAGAQVLHCAVGEKDQDNITFYANARGSLSTLDKSQEARWKRDYKEWFSGFDEQIVNMRTIDSIVKSEEIKKIDFISIDIEGYEVEALEGLDFGYIKPTVLVIESHNEEHRNKIESILFSHGYFYIAKLGVNLFYSIDENMKRKIESRVFENVHLFHQHHPLDDVDDITLIVDVSTVEPRKTEVSIINKIKFKIRTLLKTVRVSVDRRRLSDFVNIGFHGDSYLISVVKAILKNVDQFIETGTNVGSTLHFVAKDHPDVMCYSCEPHKETYEFALSKIKVLSNVRLKNELSPEFLYNLESEDKNILRKDTVFWLDSHGYGFTWPLKKEVEFITKHFEKAYIFIDDFKVPDQPQFIYDEYDGQVCEWDFIKRDLIGARSYNVVYPSYKHKTSAHHPLKGWILIEFGHVDFKLVKSEIQGFISHKKVTI